MGQQNDPMAQYVYGQTGIPQGFTQGLQNFGFMGAPFGGVEQNFDAQERFMQLMKSMFDQQLGMFNNGNNIRALPMNMRNMFNSAAPLLTDPMYGILGAPGMFSNGWQSGALPQNQSWAHRTWQEQSQGYPNIPAPSATSAFGNPNWWNQNQQQSQNLGPPVIGSSNPADYQGPNAPSAGPGGRNIAASQAAADIGTHSGTDASGNSYTISKPYGQMSDQEKDDANRFAHNMTG